MKKNEEYYIELLENYTIPEYYQGKEWHTQVQMGKMLEQDIRMLFDEQGHDFDFKIGCRISGVLRDEDQEIPYEGTFKCFSLSGIWVDFDEPIFIPSQDCEESTYCLNPLNFKDTVKRVY